MRFEDKLIENLVFGRSGLNSRVFEKLFISYSYILFVKHCALRSFCIKMLCFFKKLIFPNFQSIESVARLIEIAIKFLIWICLTRLAFNWCSINRNWKFSVFKYLTNLFFHASFMFRIHMHYIDFFFPSCSFAVISLIVSHITCIHFAKLGTQLDLKIDWLIFELCTF